MVVADSNNQCIQVRSPGESQPRPLPLSAISFSGFQIFSNDGVFKMRFGVRGRSPGQLQRPTGVTVDVNGDIVVADYDNRWVSIFSAEGKFKVASPKQNLFFGVGGGGIPEY